MNKTLLTLLVVAFLVLAPATPQGSSQDRFTLDFGSESNTEQAESTNPTNPTSVLAGVRVHSDEEMLGTHHQNTLNAVRQVIQDNSDLRPLQKRRLLRRLSRPNVAVRVTDHVTMAGLDGGAIAMTPHGSGFAIDWENLLNIIKEILPIILQLISLFG